MITYEKKQIKRIYTQEDINPFARRKDKSCYDQLEADLNNNPKWHMTKATWSNNNNTLTVYFKVEADPVLKIKPDDSRKWE